VHGVAAELALERFRRALGDDLTAIDDREPRSQLVGLLEVVGRQQDGLVLLGGQPRDLAPHLGAHLRVQTRGRLVEEEHLWVVDERHRDVQPSLHPPGVAAGDAVGRLGQTEALEQLRDPLLEYLAAHAVEVALETEVLTPRRLDVDPRALRDDADRPPDPVGLRRGVDAGDHRPALVGLCQRRQDLDRGRLAGAVGPQ
jgi:hypothetical protein